MAAQLQPPVSFPFPFTPYEIQHDFMTHLYKTLEAGKIGIFESPTGTGKSLSLICGSLKWLVDHNDQEQERMEALMSGKATPSDIITTSASEVEESGSVPDWFLDYDKQKAIKDETFRLKRVAERKKKKQERISKLKEKYGHSLGIKGHLQKEGTKDSASVELSEDMDNKAGDEDLVVEEYFSDDECRRPSAADSDDSDDNDDDDDGPLKIFYASRTHSQLSQFVHEIQKTPYKECVTVIPLGSRLTYCINERVRKLKSITLINERCLELKRNKVKASVKKLDGELKKKRPKPTDHKGCPFNKPAGLETLRDLSLGMIQDIEQLVSVGKEIGVCPYYATRYAVPEAQLVVLPYNSLLHASTRESLGIKLKNNIVIIDEAHNLLDTISSVHSVFINSNHLKKTLSQLELYKDRYKSRLKSKNLLYINQLIHILKQLIKLLNTKQLRAEETNEELTELTRLNEFMIRSEIDNINLFKVLKYCSKSEIAKKLNGFAQKYFSEVSVDDSPEVMPSSPMLLIEQFIEALTGQDEDSRIVIKQLPAGSPGQSSLRYLLLNPSVHFADVVKDARSVILAGGTMEPISEFKDQLFKAAGINEERFEYFSCGHVIGSDRLLPVALAQGPSGLQFEFTFQKRMNPSMIDELGRTVGNICTITPGGVVCFFPSYDYEHKVLSRWEETGQLQKIAKKKQVFREPKLASQVEQVLHQYGRCIELNCKLSGGNLTGAIILCVVGGKLSEGINFADDLGRCIIMIGLPFPNSKSPELKEKMDYLDKNWSSGCRVGKSPGQAHYENLCMKAVNQSIGRAIRHANDYASIVLVDHRYCSSSIYSKLPKWISSELVISSSFGHMFGAVRKFYSTKR